VKMARKLAAEAKIPAPNLYIVGTRKDAPTRSRPGGTPDGTICFTESMLTLEDDEIEAVMAHEMAHIKNRDTLVQMMAATIAGAVAYIAQIAYWSMFSEFESRTSTSIVGLIMIMIFRL